MRQMHKVTWGRLDPQQDRDACPGGGETEMSEANTLGSQSEEQDNRKRST